MSTAVLVYDGDCGICEKCAGWIRTHLTHIKVVSHYAYGINDLSAVLLVEDTTKFAGAAAIARMLKTSPLRRYKVMGDFLNAPGVRIIARVVYSLIARNRSRISRMFGLTACAVDAQRSS